MKTFEPMKIKDMKIDNRVGVAPMCTFLCEAKDGVANDFHFAHYANLALGQPGFIIQEATAINEQGYISDFCLGIYKPRQKEALTHLVDLVHRYHTKIGIQLNHAGKKSKHHGITKIGPSKDEDVVEASIEDINKIINDFAAAAKTARNIGYDFIEVHGAHGYLINQFLSPLTNQRTDIYGQNRFLFLEEIVKAVIHEFDGPVFVRISGEEYDENGNHIEDLIEVSKKLEALKVSLINVSSGGFVNMPFEPYPLYQVNLATAIKEQVSIPVATAGLIQTYEDIASIIDQDKADIVLLGRKLLEDPYFILKWKYKVGLIKEEDIKNYMYRALKTL